ncbi:MAG: 8-amino-7-oxononanoate synthase [Allomuricauda sp.]
MTNGSVRSLPERGNLIDFSSNDYLGLARNGSLENSISRLLKEHQTMHGSTGSRLLTGNHPLYAELEQFLVEFHNAEAALAFNSGYDANVGFFSCVPQRGDVVFYDESIHASIRDGLQLGNAKSYKFLHNDLGDLEKKVRPLRAQSGSDLAEIYVVTESVFSMDGDSPDLRLLSDFCKAEDLYLVVDEAHAVGIFGEGKGMLQQLGLEQEVFARIVTFGKALGCHGAAVLGCNSLKNYLINFARSLIYTTALPPHTLATVLASYQQLKERGEQPSHALRENILYFKQQIVELGIESVFIESYSAIQCAIVSGNEKVKRISGTLQAEGYDVKPILSPTVKEGEERLRFCLHAYNTKEEISRVLSILKSILE